jgi:endonuclease/exonuclease/phosphatase family metal-dependent hydrolase
MPKRAMLTVSIALALGAGCAVRPTPPAVPLWSPCTQAHCLRVLSWNVHAIPFVSSHPTRRLRNVAAKIREQRPDVVLLQEVWAHAYVELLRRRLAGEYRVTRAFGCGRPFPCGGLVVLVRVASGWVASRPTFVPFDAAAPWHRLAEWDGIAKKGMLLVRLERGEQSVGIVDTHLQSRYPQYGRTYSAIRRRQLEQLARTVDATFGRRAAIVAGDLNTAPNERRVLYASHVAPLGDDRTAALRAACPRCGTRVATKSPRWIDYVITRGLVATSTATRITNDGLDDPYSDHDGLLLRLECEPAAPCGI